MGSMDFVKKFGRVFFTQQSNSGAEAILVGKVSGNLTIVHFNGVSSVPHAGTDDLWAAQSQVLRLLDQLPNKSPVLTFMERQFGTRTVARLNRRELFSLQSFAEKRLASLRSAEDRQPTHTKRL